MSKKYMQQATREGRVALLPEWLQVGRRVWYWRESLCDDDGCPDMVTSSCPLNNGFASCDEPARDCSQQHPFLEETMVWSAGAYFTPRGIEWVINDLPAVADCRLRSAFFTSRKTALENKPGRIIEDG